MPVNTSMNRWSRIASNIDIESTSLINLSDGFNKTSIEHSQHRKAVQCTKNISSSNLQQRSDDDL